MYLKLLCFFLNGTWCRIIHLLAWTCLSNIENLGHSGTISYRGYIGKGWSTQWAYNNEILALPNYFKKLLYLCTLISPKTLSHEMKNKQMSCFIKNQDWPLMTSWKCTLNLLTAIQKSFAMVSFEMSFWFPSLNYRFGIL